MEIAKVWTLSTGHITKETDEFLSKAVDSANGPAVYAKGEYGYYIPVLDDSENTYPEDLQRLIDVAKDLDCGLICLDRDGEILSWLPVYDW